MAYNCKNPAVRRILRELAELRTQHDKDILEPSGAFCSVETVNDNLFELHFTIRGPPDTPYELGCYHGKLILPHDYPFKPPEITFLTPNGRFEVRKKICLSVSDYHPESWQPAWGIRTVLIGISGFMAIESAGSIGSVIWTKEERIILAKESLLWKCSDCMKSNLEILPHRGPIISKIEENKLMNMLNFTYSKEMNLSNKDVIDIKTKNDNNNNIEENNNHQIILSSSSNISDNNNSDLNIENTPLIIVNDNIPNFETITTQNHENSNISDINYLASIRLTQLQNIQRLRQADQDARTTRSRIDLLIIVLIFAVFFKLFT